MDQDLFSQRQESVFYNVSQLGRIEGLSDEQQESLSELSISVLKDCKTEETLRPYILILNGLPQKWSSSDPPPGAQFVIKQLIALSRKTDNTASVVFPTYTESTEEVADGSVPRKANSSVKSSALKSTVRWSSPSTIDRKDSPKAEETATRVCMQIGWSEDELRTFKQFMDQQPRSAERDVPVAVKRGAGADSVLLSEEPQRKRQKVERGREADTARRPRGRPRIRRSRTSPSASVRHSSASNESPTVNDTCWYNWDLSLRWLGSQGATPIAASSILNHKIQKPSIIDVDDDSREELTSSSLKEDGREVVNPRPSHIELAVPLFSQPSSQVTNHSSIHPAFAVPLASYPDTASLYRDHSCSPSIGTLGIDVCGVDIVNTQANGAAMSKEDRTGASSDHWIRESQRLGVLLQSLPSLSTRNPTDNLNESAVQVNHDRRDSPAIATELPLPNSESFQNLIDTSSCSCPDDTGIPDNTSTCESRDERKGALHLGSNNRRKKKKKKMMRPAIGVLLENLLGVAVAAKVKSPKTTRISRRPSLSRNSKSGKRASLVARKTGGGKINRQLARRSCNAPRNRTDVVLKAPPSPVPASCEYDDEIDIIIDVVDDSSSDSDHTHSNSRTAVRIKKKNHDSVRDEHRTRDCNSSMKDDIEMIQDRRIHYLKTENRIQKTESPMLEGINSSSNPFLASIITTSMSTSRDIPSSLEYTDEPEREKSSSSPVPSYLLPRLISPCSVEDIDPPSPCGTSEVHQTADDISPLLPHYYRSPSTHTRNSCSEHNTP